MCDINKLYIVILQVKRQKTPISKESQHINLRTHKITTKLTSETTTKKTDKEITK